MTLSPAMKVGLFFASLLLPLLIGLAVLASLQSSFVFPVSSVPNAKPPRGAIPLTIKAADGATTLKGWHVGPADGANGKAVILGFGGNGWAAANMASTLHRLFPDDDVVVVSYRGYPPSGGEPSAAAILADAPLVFDRAAAIAGKRPIIGVGFSIGAGVAAVLSATRPLSGLILVTPFDTLERVAAEHMPWVPMALIFRHQIDASSALRTGQAPVSIIAASNDSIVPKARTDQLRRDVANLVFDRTLDGSTHNDIYAHPDFARSIADARESLRR